MRMSLTMRMRLSAYWYSAERHRREISRSGAESDVVIDRRDEVLVRAKVALGRLNRLAIMPVAVLASAIRSRVTDL